MKPKNKQKDNISREVDKELLRRAMKQKMEIIKDNKIVTK